MNNRNDDHWYWGKQLAACFDDLQAEFQQHDPPVVDREIVPPFCGSPERISAWFICEKTAEVKSLKAAEQALKSRIQSRMECRGFSVAAISSLRVNSTSLEDIENGGGRFYFFR